MAVVISLLATALPWGPIMAFLVSSPLMSPEVFVFYAGILGINFAAALTAASVGIGLAGGYFAYVLEKKTGFLDGQIRFSAPAGTGATCSCAETAAPITAQSACGSADAPGPVVPEPCDCNTLHVSETACCGDVTSKPEISACGCHENAATDTVSCIGAGQPSATSAPACGCDFVVAAPSRGCGAAAAPVVLNTRMEKIKEMLQVIYDIGVKKILVYFSLFAAIGFFVNRLVPAELIMALFNGSHWYAVPLAALIGLPLYVTGASALPLLQVLLNAGASSGAVLAFLITGPATSVGVIAGISTIMKQKAIALYVAIILVGGIIAGYAYDLVLRLM